jgi:hypothetical protein
MVWQIATATHFPIHEALVPAKLFELGIGNLVQSLAAEWTHRPGQVPAGRLLPGSQECLCGHRGQR